MNKEMDNKILDLETKINSLEKQLETSNLLKKIDDSYLSIKNTQIILRGISILLVLVGIVFTPFGFLGIKNYFQLSELVNKSEKGLDEIKNFQIKLEEKYQNPNFAPIWRVSGSASIEVIFPEKQKGIMSIKPFANTTIKMFLCEGDNKLLELNGDYCERFQDKEFGSYNFNFSLNYVTKYKSLINKSLESLKVIDNIQIYFHDFNDQIKFEKCNLTFLFNNLTTVKLVISEEKIKLAKDSILILDSSNKFEF
jgi:hypothetical protein